MYEVIYTPLARSDLKSIDLKVSRRIISKIDFYSKSKDPLLFAKRLKNPTIGDFRFRIGDYRAIFDLAKNNEIKILLILKVAHRKKVYMD